MHLAHVERVGRLLRALGAGIDLALEHRIVVGAEEEHVVLGGVGALVAEFVVTHDHVDGERLAEGGIELFAGLRGGVGVAGVEHELPAAGTGPGRSATHDRMCWCDGVSLDWNNSPVTPSIAAAATITCAAAWTASRSIRSLPGATSCIVRKVRCVPCRIAMATSGSAAGSGPSATYSKPSSSASVSNVTARRTAEPGSTAGRDRFG